MLGLGAWAGRGVATGTRAASSTTVDTADVARFARLAADWHSERGPFRALHSMNERRVPWIVREMAATTSEQTKEGWTFFNGSGGARPAKVLEVGCGGGLLSVALARSGLDVRGIDVCPQSIGAAETVKQWPTISDAVKSRLQFECISAEALAEKEPGAFDAIVASEVVEHVASVPTLLRALSSLARPGARLFMTTMNRTAASRVGAVWMAEEVLGIVPEGMHDWAKFITPEELAAAGTEANWETRAIHGLAYDPFGNNWNWTPYTGINYALLAVKK